MSDISSVKKDQKNTAQGFKFRGIDQFVNALYPALTKHGVFMTPRCTSESHELKEVVRATGKNAIDKHVTIQMEYTFYAEDGSSVTVGPIPAEGLDSGDKATNKALSAALKYALIQTFSIPTVDMEEGDLTTPEIGLEAKTNSITVDANGNVPVLAGNVSQNITATNEIPGQKEYQQVKKSSFRKSVVKEEPKVETSLSDGSKWDN